MRTRTLLVVLAALLVAAFAAANWSAFMAPTKLSVLVTSFEAPLGLVMLGILIVVTGAAALYMALWQGAILLETRRHAKELQAQRTLAEQAEASRFTQLRAALHEEVERIAVRMEAAHEALRVEICDNANSLAATIAEMDDRLHGALIVAKP